MGIRGTPIPGPGNQVKSPMNDDGTNNEDDQYEAAHRRAGELAAEFAKSPAVADLPADARDDFESVAFFLLDYARDYAGVKPEDLDESALREVLLDVFPRKVSGSKLFFERTIPAAQAFLDWLQAKGIVADIAGLKQTIGKWHEEIVAKGNDSRSWGMAKRFVLAAQERGVDLGDKEAMQSFIGEYNRTLGPVGRKEPPVRHEPPQETFEPVSAPIVGDAPKVGRNEPCPCGSGKKYKKCCGR
jgi:hypothetical protein